MAGLALQNPSAGGIEGTWGREDILATYRRLRAATREHNANCMELIPGGALLHQGRRLGIVQGKTFLLDDMEELNFVFDLAIHTAPPGRQRVIDRYARATKLQPESVEALALDAMRRSRFSIVRVERRHPVGGLIVRDLATGEEIWLIDEALEASAPEDLCVATRLYPFEHFCIMAGVMAPVESELLVSVIVELPFLARKTRSEAIADRRFAEALYRLAIEDGVSERVQFIDAPPE